MVHTLQISEVVRLTMKNTLHESDNSIVLEVYVHSVAYTFVVGECIRWDHMCYKLKVRFQL